MDIEDLSVGDRVEVYTPTTGTYWGFVSELHHIGLIRLYDVAPAGAGREPRDHRGHRASRRRRQEEGQPMTARSTDLLDAVADGVHWLARATGIAWLWDRVADLLRPLVAPLDRWQRQHGIREGTKNLALAASLEQAGLRDSAAKLRELANRQINGR